MQNGEDSVSGKCEVEAKGGTEILGKIPAQISESSERKIILLLCLLAAVHVFVYSAAFPFFNNVDEPAHLDLVLQYSHGHIPRGMEYFSKEASVYLALFCSSAYFGPTTGPIPPPPWTQPVEKMRKDLLFNSTGWQTQKNYEDGEPPLYYALAGLWWHIGKWLGFGDGHLLYWLRFLNIALIVAIVWLGYFTARMVFPGHQFVRLGVPAVLAFMPQTAFYSIEDDVLSVIGFGVAFICVLRWTSAENISAPLGAATGLMFAATCLTKMTNLPLLGVAGISLAVKTWQFARDGKLRTAAPALVAFVCCAVLPIGGWILWSKFSYGDFTGSKMKMDHFNWTVKPFSEWWHHPIFTPVGFWTYLSGQISTFWQGEFKWFYPPSKPLALPGTDIIYTTLTLVLVAPALANLFSRTNLSQLQRQALELSLACFVAALGFFAFMSIIYDFSYSPNPSRAHPYFQAGRMFLGMLIPFLLLFVYGLDRLLNRFGNKAKFATLAVSISVMLAVEIATDWPAFFNDYNWYHLP